MRQAIIPVSEAGEEIARKITAENGGDIIKRSDVQLLWDEYDAFVFIGAMGICVRTIAPLIKDKHSDPAVICVDSMGKAVIPVLSGHIGGANDLARLIARTLGAFPVITTQSDLMGLWALDTLHTHMGWTAGKRNINHEIVLFTAGKPTALLTEVRDKGTEWMEANLPENVTVFRRLEDIDRQRYKLLILVSPYVRSDIGMPFVHYIPHCVHLGIGLARQAQPAEGIINDIFAELQACGIAPEAVADISTITEKKGEPVISTLKETYGIRLYSADELREVDVPNPSPTVERHMGVASVCEAAALLSSGNGRLIVEKRKGANWTMAVALDASAEPHGHIEIVGAGPGDPDLVSVRGRRFLERADLILYAGSLVPKELTDCAKAGATVRSSATMTLEEQCALMSEFYNRGKLIVRLHTGDPCIFGAIQEQMAYFDSHGMSYHITPGISSFLAAAAELRSQFTIPEKTQTIILTRGEGRTPMPEREKLSLLARSRSTMCIFLSAAIVDNVQEQLLQEYPKTTPVAACYHLTWGDQKIYRGQLKDLAKIVKDNNLTLTTMIVVGEAIDNRQGLSELYSKHFTHLFRKAEEEI